jgi:hypothetical protein
MTTDQLNQLINLHPFQRRSRLLGVRLSEGLDVGPPRE